MIVRMSLLVAPSGPWANVTVIRWLGVVLRRDNGVGLGNRLLHLGPDQPDVGGVVVHAVGLDGRLGIWRDDTKALGQFALRDAEHLGVQTELQNSSRASFARELGVSDFVRPAPSLLGSSTRRITSGRPYQRPSLNALWTMTSTPARIASSV